MKTYRGGQKVKKHSMSNYKFKNVGNNRGKVMDGLPNQRRYGQSTGKKSPSNES